MIRIIMAKLNMATLEMVKLTTNTINMVKIINE